MLNKWNVIVDDKVVATVEAEAGFEARARLAARKLGYRFFDVVEIRDPLPGEREFYIWQEWTRKCRELSREACHEEWYEKLEGQPGVKLPQCPLTAEELAAAKRYMHFLGVRYI